MDAKEVDSPTMAADCEDVENTSEHTSPETKSGVRVDPNAKLQSAKFGKGDIVHTSQNDGVRMTKITGEVYKLQYNPKGYIEYKLKEPLAGTAIHGGAWFRERELRLQRKAG